jgi:phosphonate transport system permease protein
MNGSSAAANTDRLAHLAAARARARRGLAGGLVLVAALLAAVVASFAYLSLDLRGLFSPASVRLMGEFAAQYLHPDLEPAYVRQVAFATLQTLAVSAVGTALAFLAGALLALPAAGRAGPVAKAAARFVLNALRSVPELVWAAVLVIAADYGPFAGTLALAIHTTGVLGRLFAETLENVPPAPETALREAGPGAVAAFAYGAWPLALPQWIAYTLYRWEINIRMAAVLGFVGAGGLGQMLWYRLSLLQHAQAATVLIGMFVLVFGVDAISQRWRAGLATAQG